MYLMYSFTKKIFAQPILNAYYLNVFYPHFQKEYIDNEFKIKKLISTTISHNRQDIPFA